MNETLAALLAARLQAALPFLDRVTGLARLYTTSVQNGDSAVPIKLPVPVYFTAADCENNSRYLVPDAGTVGTLFFEDNGGGLVQPADGLGRRTASLRLLLWLNPLRLDGDLSEVALTALVERALSIGQRYSAGPFLDIATTATVLPAETSLYGRYTFDTVTPLLLPPYRLLGLSLAITYRLNTACLPVTLPGVKDLDPC